MVVLLAGAGESSYSWTHVHREVARFARVVAYDRAGLGSSEPGPPPSPDGYIADLEAVAASLGLTAPLI